ncbi:putative RNA helicase [Coemansia erecta]|uniref:RNA helicase n=1 Tax=Coemansia erecta TaxID=147472 RepID=A0A9W7XWZ0_9FUNG|nr:putative RNA helicase [Coemansia erecta]
MSSTLKEAVRELPAEMDGDEIKVTQLSSQGSEYPAPPMCTFKALGLDAWLVDTLRAMSITQPTEIQRACIPAILGGRDVIGGAKTGSGKTAAFALPILQQLSEDPYGVFAVVLTPTRELAFQIAEQFSVLGRGVNVRVTVAIGGVDMMAQARELIRRPHIIVATPGRLADHIASSGSGALHLSGVRYLVLDEADRLLSDTFADDLACIMAAVPRENRRTLLFTATMTESIVGLKERKHNAPFVHLCDSGTERTVQGLTQQYLFVPSHVKDAYLVELLSGNVAQLEKRHALLPEGERGDDDTENSSNKQVVSAGAGTDKSIIIFVGQCQAAETLRVMLFSLGFRVTALHSRMPQSERLASLGKFRARAVRILVATDVAARGLDIPEVELVVNMHVPRDPDEYIHRVGRTARAGRGGRAVTIVTERDIKLVHNIEARIGRQLDKLALNEQSVLDGMGRVLVAKRAAALHLLESDFGARDKIRQKKREAAAGSTADNRPQPLQQQQQHRKKHKKQKA